MLRQIQALEREQAQGGFTGLLLALAACVAERTKTSSMRHSSKQDPSRHHMDKGQLGNTLGSNDRTAYQAVGTTLPHAEQAERRNEATGGKSRARGCLILNSPALSWVRSPV